MLARKFYEQTVQSGLRNRGSDAKWGDYEITYRDLRPLKINAGLQVHFLSRPGWTATDRASWEKVAADLVAYSRERSRASVLAFVTDQQCPITEHPDFRQHAISVLDKEAISTFLNGRDLSERYAALGRALSRGIGVTALSPYVPGKPASGGRFFGRAQLLDRIVAGKAVRNATLVGNRRIGKTSLMQEIRERLSDNYVPGESIFFADLYGAKLKSTWDAVYLVCSQIDLNVPKNYMKLGAISERYVLRFPKLLHKFAKERDALVVIFIDEFDSFLEIDSNNQYQFLHLLREAAMADANCYTILAGFRRLMEARERMESPYFNFTDEIHVTPLNRDETLDMVTVPLERLGIDVDGTNIPGLIHSETRGRPELIQMYCRAVVELYKKSGTVPKENELLTAVRRDPAFNRTILHTFLKNTNPFEQLISLHLIQRAIREDRVTNFEFTAGEVEELRAKLLLPLSNAQTATLLNNLVVGSIIERIMGAPGRYRFSVPQLLRFCKELNIFTLLATAEADAARTPPTIYGLNMDTAAEEADSTYAGA